MNNCTLQDNKTMERIMPWGLRVAKKQVRSGNSDLVSVTQHIVSGGLPTSEYALGLFRNRLTALCKCDAI
jgi:hypothetical protein